MKILLKIFLAIIPIACLFPATGKSANFSISPVRVYFDHQKNTDIIKVRNLLDTPLKLQLSLYAWSQDESAGDVTVPTDDIIAFPRLFTIEGDQEHVIRIGRRVAAENTEKTYRLYIEEISGKNTESSSTGPVIRTMTRVGIPIFLSPGLERQSMYLEKPWLKDGRVGVSVINDGNMHLVIHEVTISGIDNDGTTVLENSIAGWYLLAGSKKIYQIDVPAEQCVQLRSLNVNVSTDKMARNERIDVDPKMCRQ